MKVKIECRSPLLQYTLEKFLKKYLHKNGVVITDDPEKEGILIGKDIKKPFTKASLLIQLEKLLNVEKEESFEEKLDFLLNNFKKDLINLIKEHYGEK